jgi:flotillin
MDLTNMIIDLKVTAAYSKGGIPLEVEGVANIKIAGEEPAIHNAIERFLGKPRQQIMSMAKETLEGNLRGVLACLTPEQVNEDKIAFSRSLLEEAEDDLQILGLSLDTLQIQNIADSVKYLDSIGRKMGAELIRDARIEEATKHSLSTVRTAENEQKTSFAQIDASIEKARADARRRIADTTTKREAVVAEVQAEVGAKVARATAEIGVQTARIEQTRRRLQADVVVPASAGCKQREASAKADAAKIIEDGRANVEGFQVLINSWKNAGDSARDVFLLQKLEILLDTLIDTVKEIEVERLTVIDSAQGGGAMKSAAFLEKLKQASGIDVGAAVQNLAANQRLTEGAAPDA